MRITIAYIEEPPFGWTDAASGHATGADIELAQCVLAAIGITQIAYRATTFSALLPGVQRGEWDMNVPLFVTPQRAQTVAFSAPVWAIGDGFLLRAGNPKSLANYASVAQRDDARLGLIAGQVQHDSALAAGIRDSQITLFDQQSEAISALREGSIDAYASTALGNRILASRMADAHLEAVDHENESANARSTPVGAFSFNRNNTRLLAAVNAQLHAYLGSADHRSRMARYGLSNKELDAIVAPPQAS
ncbi:transporter substrate-binding domain-containing protein [Paraburkholderia sp.]|uniref:transporter substrate-binding domain-containing protein n=1 Tax=Paraburkholderia sp. TaxID=1926495 RepID=UPI00286F5DBD|nr:transporter substrate-binding domain-containing protein [Paraburkholderia sp.]